MAFDFESLDGWLLERIEEIFRAWYPDSRRLGREWCIGDIDGAAGQSFKCNSLTGIWKDWSTGQGGRGLIALYAKRHHLSQLDAAKELAGKYGYGNLESNVVPFRPAISDHSEERFELPPADAPLQPTAFKHPTHGLPYARYVYTTIDGRPIFVMARYHTSGGKHFSPWSWQEGRWKKKAIPKPWPLYGLHRLEGMPGPVIIVEGEKAADALQSKTTRSAVVCWPHGTQSVKHADWSVLRGRQCIIWPDADDSGFGAAQQITAILLAQGCSLKIVDTEGLEQGYDAADLIREETTRDEVNAWLGPRIRDIQAPEPAPVEEIPGAAPRPPVTIDGQTGAPDPAYKIATKYSLSFSKSGVHANMANVRALIRGRIEEGSWDPVHYDEFLQKVMTGHPGEYREWTDWDTLRVLDEVQSRFGIYNLRKSAVEDAVALYAYQFKRNSAMEWVDGLEWDGTARLESLFPVGFGARPNAMVTAIGRCFLMGMIARIIWPGTQVDNLPVLEGAEGIRKSTGLAVLGGPFYTECMESVNTKDFYLVLTGKMLVVMSELTSLEKSDISRIKGMITVRTDRYRAPYDRRAADHPRSCVFAATVNVHDWNRSDSGARRFWPVLCERVDIDWLKEHREQLFAEAKTYVREGKPWHEFPIEVAKFEQDRRKQEDVLWPAIHNYLRGKKEVNLHDVFRHGLDMEDYSRFDRATQMRVVSALKHFGFEAKDERLPDGTMLRVWVRPGSMSQLEIPMDAAGDPY